MLSRFFQLFTLWKIPLTDPSSHMTFPHIGHTGIRGIHIAPNYIYLLAGHRLTSASDREAALFGDSRDVPLVGWILTALNQVLTTVLVPSFSPQLQRFKLLLCFPSSFLLLPLLLLYMSFTPSVHTCVTHKQQLPSSQLCQGWAL